MVITKQKVTGSLVVNGDNSAVELDFDAGTMNILNTN